MRVLVLNPGSFDAHQYVKEGRCESRKSAQLTVPVTLGLIAALLRCEGHDVTVKDLMLSPLSEQGLRELFGSGYDLFLVSTSTPTYAFDLRTMEIIRASAPRAHISAFGTVVSAMPEDVLRAGLADSVIRKEPEMTACELSLRLASAGPGADLSRVEGLSFREGERIVHNPRRQFIDDLDALPYPARDLMETGKYRDPRTGKPYTVIKVGRGCPFSCIFCTTGFYYGRKWRMRSPENILGEIVECVEKYAIRDFLFLSDTFNIDREKIIALCEAIVAGGLDIRWVCNSRVDTLDSEMAGHMKRAGCWLISFGVESGDSDVLKAIKKAAEPEQAVEAARICRSAGIKSLMYYILGFPGETREQMENTIRLAMRANSDFARFYTATPLPGSEMFDRIKDTLALGEVDFTRFNLINCDIVSCEVDSAELKRIIRNAHLRYYLRPLYILRMLCSYRPSEFWNILKTAGNYFRGYIRS